MFKTKEEVIENIGLIMAQTEHIIKNREFGLGISNVYYMGGTLCVDIHNNSKLSFVVMININGEEFNVIDCLNNSQETRRLLPIKALRTAFDIYKDTKGETEYYKDCFNQSCLRHLN